MKFVTLLGLVLTSASTTKVFAFSLGSSQSEATVRAHIAQVKCSFGASSVVKLIVQRPITVEPSSRVRKVSAAISDELCSALMAAAIKASPAERSVEAEFKMDVLTDFDSKWGARVSKNTIKAFDHIEALPGSTLNQPIR